MRRRHDLHTPVSGRRRGWRPRVSVKLLLALVVLTTLTLWLTHNTALYAWWQLRQGRILEAWSTAIGGLPAPASQGRLVATMEVVLEEARLRPHHCSAILTLRALRHRPDATRVLLDVLEDPTRQEFLRVEAAQALGAGSPAGQARVVRALSRTLHMQEPYELRRVAAWALAAHGDDGARALLAVLTREERESSLDPATLALASIIAEHPELMAHILQALPAASPRQGRRLARLLSHMSPADARVVPRLRELLVVEGTLLDLVVASALAAQGPGAVDALPDLRASLDRTGSWSWWDRTWLAAAILAIDPDPETVREALLRPLPGPHPPPGLEPARPELEEGLRELTLQRAGAPLADLLCQALNREDLLARLALADLQTMGAHGTMAVPALLKFLGDPASGEHLEVSLVRAISTLAPEDPRVSDALEERFLHLARSVTGLPEQRYRDLEEPVALAEVLVERGRCNPELSSFLAEVLYVPGCDPRAVRILTVLGPRATAALPRLRQGLAAPDPRRPNATIEALAAIAPGDPAVQQEVEDLLEADVAEARRHAARLLPGLARPREELRAHLRRLLRDRELRVCVQAARSLARIEEPPDRWVPRLFELLRFQPADEWSARQGRLAREALLDDLHELPWMQSGW